MDVIEIALNMGGIGLFLGPVSQHGGPSACGADGIHADTQGGVVESHGFGEGIHRSLGGSIGRMDFLADDTHKAGGVEDIAFGSLERFKTETGRVVDAFDIDGKKRVPLIFRCLMEGLRRMGNARVVVDDIKTPKMGNSPLDCGLDLISLRHIAREADMGLAQLCRSRRSRLAIAGDEAETSPLFGVGFGTI